MPRHLRGSFTSTVQVRGLETAHCKNRGAELAIANDSHKRRHQGVCRRTDLTTEPRERGRETERERERERLGRRVILDLY